MAKKQGFQVAYCVGGRDRFHWRLVSDVFDLEAARRCEEELNRQGYKTLLASDGGFRHGLPETFESDENPALFGFRDGWLCRK